MTTFKIDTRVFAVAGINRFADLFDKFLDYPNKFDNVKNLNYTIDEDENTLAITADADSKESFIKVLKQGLWMVNHSSIYENSNDLCGFSLFDFDWALYAAITDDNRRLNDLKAKFDAKTFNKLINVAIGQDLDYSKNYWYYLDDNEQWIEMN